MIKISKIEFAKISKNKLKDWNYVLEFSNEATIFHTPEWIFFMIEKTGVKGEILIAYNNNKPVGIFPYYLKKGKFFFNKSTTGTFETPYGGPIHIKGSNKNIIIQLLKNLEKNFNIVKTTVFYPPKRNNDPFKDLNYSFKKKESMVLSLEPTEEELWSQLHKMKKRNVRKAEKNDVRIIDSDLKYISDFHCLLSDTYNRLSLRPPKEIDFYNKLFELFLPLNRIKLLIAEFNGKPIAAAIFLLYKETMIFWQGASYREFMKYGPNDLIHWSIIKFGKQHGFNSYDLLQFHDNKGDELEPLKKFKQGFGAIPQPYYSFTKEFGLNKKLKNLYEHKSL